LTSSRYVAHADDSTVPLETSPPVIGLMNPRSSAARRAVLDTAHLTRLGVGDAEDLLMVNETVSNALCHGRHRLGRMWGLRTTASWLRSPIGHTDPCGIC
jgi:hypothetical protein